MRGEPAERAHRGPRAALCATALALAAGARSGAEGVGHEAALATITAAELGAHVAALADPALEGRDSPSAGLELAAEHIERAFASAGVEPGGTEGYRFPFVRRLPTAVPDRTALELVGVAGARPFRYGVDFVPLAYCGGAAEGELVFCGFGIRAKRERYDDLKGAKLAGAVAVIVEGEPRHPKRFEGAEESRYATLWDKLDELADERVAGVLVVRRPVREKRCRATRPPASGRWPSATPSPPGPSSR